MRSIHIKELKKGMVVIEDGAVLICVDDSYRVDGKNFPNRDAVGWECEVLDTRHLYFKSEWVQGDGTTVSGRTTKIFQADQCYAYGLDLYRVK